MSTPAGTAPFSCRRAGLAILLAIFALVGPLTGAASEPADAVLRADEARLGAMLAADVPALERALTDDCLYVHSNGLTQTKSDLIAALKSGAMKYTAIRYVAPPRVRVYGESAAVVTGMSQVAVALPDGRTATPTLLITALYVWQDARWQLASYQSTTAPAK